jgi:hypothetical protein
LSAGKFARIKPVGFAHFFYKTDKVGDGGINILKLSVWRYKKCANYFGQIGERDTLFVVSKNGNPALRAGCGCQVVCHVKN